MSVRRRPASRVPALRRKPAGDIGEAVKTDKFTYLLELTAAQLRCLGLVELAYGYYYDGLVKVAGYITGLGRDADYLEFKVAGTQTERFVDVVSNPGRRVFQLHICPKDCRHTPTGPDILHASGYWEVGDNRQPWHTMLELTAPVEEERDELAKLREHYTSRAGGVAGEKPSPSAEEEKGKKTKKKKKKLKEKEKKQAKDKSEKADSGDELLPERGQKSLKSLFGGTCLDPRFDDRSKLLRKARRLGKKEGKKRKRSSSYPSSTGSQTSEEEELDETGEGLFAEKKRALRLTQRYPGCLGAQTIAGMKDLLLTSAGTLHSVDRRSLPPLYTQYYRAELHALVSPSMGQELLTISQTADLLLRGHPAKAIDLLSQRFKALEQQARGAHWSVARQLELVSADSVGLSQGAEGAEAARLAREEARNRTAVQRPYNAVGKEGGKAKGRSDPPEGREKGDKGGKGKGKGKKKEKP